MPFVWKGNNTELNSFRLWCLSSMDFKAAMGIGAINLNEDGNANGGSSQQRQERPQNVNNPQEPCVNPSVFFDQERSLNNSRIFTGGQRNVNHPYNQLFLIRPNDPVPYMVESNLRNVNQSAQERRRNEDIERYLMYPHVNRSNGNPNSTNNRFHQ